MVNVAVDEIKARLNITDIISEYVTLTRKGQKYWGICPFHDEKTASFSVSQDKGTYYCFGCHEHGDVFSFFQRHHGVDFNAAKILLAGKAGMPSGRLSRQDWQRIHAEQRRREQEKAIVNKLQVAIKTETNRLFDLEKRCHSILKSVTNELDFNRPAVIWALKTKDLMGYYLDALSTVGDSEKLEVIKCSKGVKLWASY